MLGKEGDGTSDVIERTQTQITAFEETQGKLQADIKNLHNTALEKKKAGDLQGAMQDVT